MDFSIELYETGNGRKVVEEELEDIEDRQPVLHALLLAGLAKLRRRLFHKPPLCMPLGDDLYELRVGRRDIARGLWFFRRGQRIVVVHCFIKKSQKTPGGAKSLARERARDYMARHGDVS